MEEKFTIEEIKNYIKSQDSLGDVMYNLKAENIKKANQKEQATDLSDLEEESDEDIIIVENGDMFEGSREQFANCYFSNADNEQIIDWCFENGWSLTINGHAILE